MYMYTYEHMELSVQCISLSCRWLDHFLPEQLLLIDGETLAIKPSIVMETVQEFLNLEMLDYNEILK